MATEADHALILETLNTLMGPLAEHGQWVYYESADDTSPVFMWGTTAYMALKADDLTQALEDGDGLVDIVRGTMEDLADHLADIADQIYYYIGPDLEPPDVVE